MHGCLHDEKATLTWNVWDPSPLIIWHEEFSSICPCGLWITSLWGTKSKQLFQYEKKFRWVLRVLKYSIIWMCRLESESMSWKGELKLAGLNMRVQSHCNDEAKVSSVVADNKGNGNKYYLLKFRLDIRKKNQNKPVLTGKAIQHQIGTQIMAEFLPLEVFKIQLKPWAVYLQLVTVPLQCVSWTKSLF